MGRTARGVTGIRIDEDDEVVGMEVIGNENTILTVSEKGFGKRTEIAEYRLQSRGGKGVIDLKTTPKTGAVAGIKQVVGNEDIMLISNTGNIIRLHVDEISVLHRNTPGREAHRHRTGKKKSSGSRGRNGATARTTEKMKRAQRRKAVKSCEALSPGRPHGGPGP